MLTRIARVAALAWLPWMAACADRGEETDGELTDGDPASLEERVVTAHDLNDFDRDGDALLNDSEWVVYSDDRLRMERWDGDASGTLEREEFGRAVAGGPAAAASFEEWDDDASGSLDPSEWRGAWFEHHDEDRDGMISPEELESSS